MLGIAVMLAQYYLQPDMMLWHTFGYYHILAMLNCLCSLWFINCTAIGRVAKDLAQNLHNALDSADASTRLAEYRLVFRKGQKLFRAIKHIFVLEICGWICRT